MTRRTAFSVLVATDGSAHGRAAVAAAVRFPWPRGSRARGLVARRVPAPTSWSPSIGAALEASVQRAARAARRILRTRWPEAEVDVVDRAPVDAILAAAPRLRAGAIVVGSRGQGTLSRLVLGSVSLGVVRRAPHAVLVVKRGLREASHLAIGVDASSHASRAVELVAGLEVPRDGRVTLIAVVEPVRPPSMGLLPVSIRGALQGELAAFAAERERAAQRSLEAAGRDLRRAGWKVETALRRGAPLDELLAATKASGAHILVVGARGVGGLERLLLGSVAEGALSRSAVPVLIVR